MVVHIVFRSYGGENLKDRPAYYSKTTALASCIRAAEEAGVDLTFFNDGPVPEDRLELMRAAGPVHTSVRNLGMRATYISAIRWAAAQDWPDEDVVWFSEDDYLYAHEAFSVLQAFAEDRPDSTYYALFGFSGTPENVRAGIAEHDLPSGWEPVTVVSDGREWVQVDSTASTFGARLGALRQDLGIFRLCMLPHRKRYRDHDTCMVYQGFEPYAWGPLLRSAVGLAPGGAAEKARGVAFAPFFIATNLRSHRRQRNRRVLLSPDPNLAAHLEDRLIPGGRDWAAEAEQTGQWLARRWAEATGVPAAESA